LSRVVSGAVLGLDLSVRRSGAVVVPEEWRPGDWEALRVITTGADLEQLASPLERARRRRDIAEELVAFAVAHDVGHVFVEEYAFGVHQNRAHELAELGGVVKDRFLSRGQAVHPVVSSSARKLIFGVVPRQRKGRMKQYLMARWAELGAPFQGDDEGDAFAVANAGLSLLGLRCVRAAVAPKRVRSRAT
jgi:Holliday junction resolvasome RuvABC endonuclease subunit